MDEDILQNMPDLHKCQKINDGSKEIMMHSEHDDNRYFMKLGSYENQRSLIQDRGIPIILQSNSSNCLSNYHKPNFSDVYHQQFVRACFQEKRQLPLKEKRFSSLGAGPGFTTMPGINDFESGGPSSQTIQASASFPFSQLTLGSQVGFRKCTEFCHTQFLFSPT